MNDQQSDPSIFLDIEGTKRPWNKPTVTAAEVAALGGWDPGQGVMLIDGENNERQLQPGEAVEVHPTHGFARKIRWRRGAPTTTRELEEIELLRGHFPGLEYVEAGGWVRLPDVQRPSGWTPPVSDVAFQIPVGFPGTPPYGFCVPAGIRHNGVLPSSYAEPAAPLPPFPGAWGKFSWTHDGADWRPTANAAEGSNLVTWVRGIGVRLAEGA